MLKAARTWPESIILKICPKMLYAVLQEFPSVEEDFSTTLIYMEILSKWLH